MDNANTTLAQLTPEQITAFNKLAQKALIKRFIIVGGVAVAAAAVAVIITRTTGVEVTDVVN